MARERQATLPEEIAPMNGRAWLEEDCEAYAAILAFEDVEDREKHLGTAIASLACFHPEWLDVLAPPKGLPNSAQATRIKALWERYGLEDQPDYALFTRQPGSAAGFVEGQIGKIWFGIDADGSAHS